MIVGIYKFTPTTATGAATDTTQVLKGQLMGITVKADTVTTTFNFAINDSDGDPIFYETGVAGTLVDNSPILLPYDMYTWVISSASADEAFTVKLKVLEATSQ